MKLHEEFKLFENMWDSSSVRAHPWMKDVSLFYPELCIGSEAEDDVLIKYTYLAGPEDVAEILDHLITNEDVAGTEYDLQTLKADLNAWYDFLDANFARLVDKYNEELLNAFESKAVEQAQLKAKEEYDIYPEGNPFFHEGAACDNKKTLKEDNMADMRRSIRAEIAELEAEKAADTDPTSAVYYDEKIAACKAELAHLSDIAPTRATAKKRELKAKNEETAKNIERRLKYLAFAGLYSIYKRPRCISTKDGEFKVYFNKQLNQEAIIEAEKICAAAGIPVKYSTQERMFIVDRANMDLHKNDLDINIDTDNILKRLSNNNLEEKVSKMATKVTKSELKQMIREALREELSANQILKEDVSTMNWDDLIAEADYLLEQLIHASDNANYDDGDGYWEEEGVTWCMRYLYYSDKLKNTKKLDKLCDVYSNKLPNVNFYFFEDEDGAISEIGYTAERD